MVRTTSSNKEHKHTPATYKELAVTKIECDLNPKTHNELICWIPDIEWIATENCMVNLLTGEARPFSPDFMCTTYIPVHFNDSPETESLLH